MRREVATLDYELQHTKNGIAGERKVDSRQE